MIGFRVYIKIDDDDDVSGKVLSLIRFANDPYTLYNRLNASRRTISKNMITCESG